MAAKKKTSFYHTRNKICPNLKQAAELFGVDEAEVLRMDAEGAPAYAERLLQLWDYKYISAPVWSGWVFSRGVLIHKGKRWRPEHLLKQDYDASRITALENEIYRMYSLAGLLKILKKLLSVRYKISITKS